jgi:uncharacterized Zn-finger protein
MILMLYSVTCGIRRNKMKNISAFLAGMVLAIFIGAIGISTAIAQAVVIPTLPSPSGWTATYMGSYHTVSPEGKEFICTLGEMEDPDETRVYLDCVDFVDSKKYFGHFDGTLELR